MQSFWMELEVTAAIADPSYWLNWRVLLCATSVLASMCTASYIIWKYDDSKRSEYDHGRTANIGLFFQNDEAWKPCLKQIHPIWLMLFRIISFSLLLTTLIVKVTKHGAHIFFFYTQWTLTLVTVYFGFGSLLSIYGCYQNQKCKSFSEADIDEEHGSNSYQPLPYQDQMDKCRIEELPEHQEQKCVLQVAEICSRLFEIIFQMSAGAVMLTDSVYWFVIFPFLNIRDYTLNFMTVNVHTLNVVLLLGDTALNCLRVPWFRIAYFILWTSAFVIFQWILHACIPVWWPYPFLDLSSPYAPFWYLLMGLMHIPCYGVFALIVHMKQGVLSRFFPDSYVGGR